MEKVIKEVAVDQAAKSETAQVDGLVKAKAAGYDGIKLRVKGEVFQFKGPKGSWMEEVDEDGKSKEEKSSKGLFGKAKHKD